MIDRMRFITRLKIIQQYLVEEEIDATNAAIDVWIREYEDDIAMFERSQIEHQSKAPEDTTRK